MDRKWLEKLSPSEIQALGMIKGPDQTHTPQYIGPNWVADILMDCLAQRDKFSPVLVDDIKVYLAEKLRGILSDTNLLAFYIMKNEFEDEACPTG